MNGLYGLYGLLAGVGSFGWWLGRVRNPGDTCTIGWEDWPIELQYAARLVGTREWITGEWVLLGLASEKTGVPTVHSITATPVGADIEVSMLTGQDITDWQKKADAIAVAFVVPKVRVSDAGHGRARLELVVFDSLGASIRVPDPDPVPDLEAVECGITENGELWLVPVLYKHVLYAGVSRSGKSVGVWALLAGLGAGIKSGLVELWGIDPKIVELSLGKPLFTRYAVGMNDQVLDLLRDLVKAMEARLTRMAAAGSRKHVPTVDEPMILAWIDEALALTAFAPDTDFRKEADRLIRLLMSAGAAAGISLIVCVQDPSKEVMAWRQMVTYRIGFRLDESQQTAMVLGHGAREKGARCDEIAAGTPGVAYVSEDGRADYMRVRAYEVTDDDVAALVAHYAPTPKPVPAHQTTTTDDDVFDDDIPGDGEGHGREAA